MLTQRDLVAQRQCNPLRFASDTDMALDLPRLLDLLNTKIGKSILTYRDGKRLDTNENRWGETQRHK